MSSAPSPAILIIIPARFASQRFPGKPLAPLRGARGEVLPLIVRTIAAAAQLGKSVLPIVATDDDRIASAAQAAGCPVVITPDDCANGTERVAAACEILERQGSLCPDAIVVNWQGDSLLTPPSFAEALIAHMQRHSRCQVATVATPCSPSMLGHLLVDQAAGRSGGTTVVTDRDGRALYFSKRILPFIPPERADAAALVKLHVGLYAYRLPALRDYLRLQESPLERIEGLEQLRFLHARIPIDVVPCPLPGWDLIELNNPDDAHQIEAILTQRGIS